MSQQRFIRCTHCGLPHEAEARACPETGLALPSAKPRPVRSPSEEGYAWAHAAPTPVAPTLDPSDLDAFIGQIVDGKYEIEVLLGRGGMGAVFRATHRQLGKQVALKVMVRGAAHGSTDEARFLQEARAAGSLGHPNIVEVHDLGRLDDGKPYQVMELLEGISLAERIAHEGALPEPEVLEIGEQLLSALAAAHAKGVIHRDIKPENVILVPRLGRRIAKLVDFGVSKVLDESSLSLTRTGVVVGTPYYLSPEQARGEPVGPSVDVWGMGVLLYEALTGVLPFNAPTYEALILKILQTAPVAPGRFQPRLSHATEAVVLAALCRDRRPRDAGASVMLEALRAARRSLEGPELDYELDGAGDQTLREPLPGASPSEDEALSVDGQSVSGPVDPQEIDLGPPSSGALSLGDHADDVTAVDLEPLPGRDPSG